MKKLFILLLALGLIVNLPLISRAGGFWGPSPEDQPSVFTYAWSGLTLGAVLGISGGYLYAVDDKEWKYLISGSAYGAIFGAGVGLTLGMIDAGKKSTGVGGIILRDMRMGAGLGMGVGLAVGTISVINNSDWDALGKGAAWGSLIGAGCGVLFGIYEGPKIIKSASLPHLNLVFVKGNPYFKLEQRF